MMKRNSLSCRNAGNQRNPPVMSAAGLSTFDGYTGRAGIFKNLVHPFPINNNQGHGRPYQHWFFVYSTLFYAWFQAILYS